MEVKKVFKGNIFSGFVFLCCFCVLTSSLCGCQTLRRKFTRKKKKDKEESQQFIPVLEPVDYAQKTYSPLERYKYHYSMWKIWSRDLILAIDDSRQNDKRQKYLLDQAVEQLTEMRELLVEESRPGLTPLIEELRGVGEYYDKPESMRRKNTMKRAVDRNSKAIRNGFAPDIASFGENQD